MANGFIPGTPATEELKNSLFTKACPDCERTQQGQNKFQCAIIQALRAGTLIPTDTAGLPCAKILFCQGCANTAELGKPCLAQAAAETLTDEIAPGMYTKATCAVALKQVPQTCPLGLAGLI